MSRACTAIVCLSLVLSTRGARADDFADITTDGHPRELLVLGVAAATWATLELGQGHFAPETCRWCSGNAFDNRARTLLLWSRPKAAATSSDILGYAVMPAGALAYTVLAAPGGLAQPRGLWDAVAVADSVAISSALTSAAQLVFARERPYVAHGNWSATGQGPSSEDNLSFWSGHTALAFSLAAATGTVASLEGRDYAGWVWAVGMTAAAAVGYLRVAADQHYLTDVLAAAAAGTAVGIAVPRLLRKGQEGGKDGLTIAITPVPIGVVGSF